MIFFTSDLHFYHKKVSFYRGFYKITNNTSMLSDYNYIDINWNELDNKDEIIDVEGHNNTIIDNINNKVNKNDTLYILGDVALTGNVSLIESAINKLNVNRKILIIGNHDRHNLKKENFRNLFSEIHEYKEIKYNSLKFCLFHYKIDWWNLRHHGSVQLFGHTHDIIPIRNPQIRQMNIGLDGNNLMPWSIDEVYDKMTQIYVNNEINHHNYE